jgi:WD40 repeat protein
VIFSLDADFPPLFNSASGVDHVSSPRPASLCGCGDFLFRGRPDSLPAYRPNAIHTLRLECRWLRGAASHLAGLTRLQPAWSPKGDWIAFTSERAGSADLYRVRPDGGDLQRLVPATSPRRGLPRGSRIKGYTEVARFTARHEMFLGSLKSVRCGLPTNRPEPE